MLQLPCVAPGTWTAWGSWGSCSATEGPGLRLRSRTCVFGDCASGGAEEAEACTGGVPPAPQTQSPTFGNWAPWSPCSDPCGGGLRMRVDMEAWYGLEKGA